VKAGAFYGCFNSGLGLGLDGTFPLAVDSCAQALLDELVCFPLIVGVVGNKLETLWQIYETLCLLLRMHACRFMSSSGCRAHSALHGG
jgi:hypothetical protein